jgi:hypothetical protein
MAGTYSAGSPRWYSWVDSQRVPLRCQNLHCSHRSSCSCLLSLCPGHPARISGHLLLYPHSHHLRSAPNCHASLCPNRDATLPANLRDHIAPRIPKQAPSTLGPHRMLWWARRASLRPTPACSRARPATPCPYHVCCQAMGVVEGLATDPLQHIGLLYGVFSVLLERWRYRGRQPNWY